MKKIKCIFQSIPNECGACCTSMVLKYYGYHTKLEDIRVNLGVGRDGVKLHNIKKFFEEKNFNVNAYKVNVNGLTKLKLPAILAWENNHYVVLESISNKYMTIIDPNIGRIKMQFNDVRNKFENYVLCLNPNEKFKKKKNETNIGFKYINVICQRKKDIGILLFTSIAYYLLTILTPIAIKSFINKKFETNLIDTNILTFISLFFIVYAITITINNAKKIILGNEIYKFINQLFFVKLLKLPYKYFETHTSEDIMFRVRCLDIIDTIYSNQFITIIFDIGILFILTIYMIFQSKVIAIFLFGLMMLLGIVVLILMKKINEYHIVTISNEKKLNSIIYEIIYSIQNIKILGIQDNIANSWKTQFEKVYKSKLKRENLESIYQSFIQCISIIGPFLIIMMAIELNEYIQISLGDLLSFYYITSTIFSFEISIISNINGYIMSLKYLEKIDEIIQEDDEILGEIELNENERWNIDIKDVDFMYNKNNSLVLEEINMQIMQDKVTAIVGESGSGKSTIIKLILGLLEPSSGEIYVNNKKLSHINKINYRNKLGIVSQDIKLINHTIYENVILDNGDISIDEVKEICKAVKIHDDIENMPMGYNTMINSMGTNLSAGQRQRILLARALVKNPKILILDEATNCLDSINEYNVIKAIQNMGCSIVMITHKIKQIKNADKIYVMNDGKIKECGNHEELINNHNFYYNLYNKS